MCWMKECDLVLWNVCACVWNGELSGSSELLWDMGRLVCFTSLWVRSIKTEF